MTSISQLYMSSNALQGKLPISIAKLCNLRSISLSGMRMSQDVSHILEILSGCSCLRFESLHLSDCHIFGRLTERLGQFRNFRQLYLFNNLISGPIPTSLGQLANLGEVLLENNLLEGVVSESHFANLTKLRDFRASGNSLTLNVSGTWVPPFQLRFLELSCWHIGPSFPSWLDSQKHLVGLDISNSRISDSIPSWFWKLSTRIRFVNLSNNQIHGQIMHIPYSDPFSVLDLSFNCFSGPLPRLSLASNQSRIDLSNNYFSGSLSRFLCYKLNDTMITVFLNLAKNLLSGEIPDCWNKWQSLMVLKLDDNRFSGRIPSSMGTLSNLQSLNLYRNNLQGEIPSSLRNCEELVAVNLGENELGGNIPGWLGHSLPNLLILILRSNKLHGNIPDDLCAVSSLQILDLADNNLLGSIPRCISNFSAMAGISGSKDTDIAYDNNTGATSESASVLMKSQFLEYDSTLNLVRVLDFSCNKLSGEIPDEMTSLRGLQSLNLSNNLLTGRIPGNIGDMKSLESLDLSLNHLSGSIPPSMSSMTFLSSLNLSYNNLIGKIPSSTQLQSFQASSYGGNRYLCGSPLEDCSANEPNITIGVGKVGKGMRVNGFYVSMAIGFITSFWTVVGSLVISRRGKVKFF